jgi:hypothetical protein
MDITFDRVIAAARLRLAALTPEVAGYVVLLIARGLERPGRVSLDGVLLDESGQIRVQAGELTSEPEAEATLRGMLATLLSLSPSLPPAIAAVAERPAGVGLRGLEAELASSLIPLNPAAAGRALARVYREVRRALADGAELERTVDDGSALPGIVGARLKLASLRGASADGAEERAAAPLAAASPPVDAGGAAAISVADPLAPEAPDSVLGQAEPEPVGSIPNIRATGEPAQALAMLEPALELEIDVELDSEPDPRNEAHATEGRFESDAALQPWSPVTTAVLAEPNAEAPLKAALDPELAPVGEGGRDADQWRGGEPDELALASEAGPASAQPERAPVDRAASAYSSLALEPMLQVEVLGEPTTLGEPRGSVERRVAIPPGAAADPLLELEPSAVESVQALSIEVVSAQAGAAEAAPSEAGAAQTAAAAPVPASFDSGTVAEASIEPANEFSLERPALVATTPIQRRSSVEQLLHQFLAHTRWVVGLRVGLRWSVGAERRASHAGAASPKFVQ